MRKSLEARLRRYRSCLEPLIQIAEAFTADGLDEARPGDWNDSRADLKVRERELFSGRGGRTLLVLGDAFAAQDAVREDDLGPPASGPSPSTPGVPVHSAILHVMQFFDYEHLPEHLQAVSKPFAELAAQVAAASSNPETTVALRKLLEAKDAAVRAVLVER